MVVAQVEFFVDLANLSQFVVFLSEGLRQPVHYLLDFEQLQLELSLAAGLLLLRQQTSQVVVLLNILLYMLLQL